MNFDPLVAEKRFGTGLSPHIVPPKSVDHMLEMLAGDDGMARRFVIPSFDKMRPQPLKIAQLGREKRKARGTDKFESASDAVRNINRDIRNRRLENLKFTMGRGIVTQDGFRERLTQFWSDHFTTIAKAGQFSHLISSAIEDTIRPNLTGKFSTMLRAAVLHPVMLGYLDQISSVGPNSELGKRKNNGLNENLAREILELHSLGVGGGYTQTDVRQFAELLTGLRYTVWRGFRFDERAAEPGAEVVLGKSYGGEGPASISDIYDALDDIAAHPDTARYIAQKLAVHFVSDTPNPDLVAAMAVRFQKTDGDLMAVYEMMLAHPAAWGVPLSKARQPFDFMVAAFRALGVTEKDVKSYSSRRMLRNISRPLRAMGQSWQLPTGPDGWPEQADHWITPQGIAARIQWSIGLAQEMGGAAPDPRQFVFDALGPNAAPEVQFAAASAEIKQEAIGIILSSPQFQRR